MTLISLRQKCIPIIRYFGVTYYMKYYALVFGIVLLLVTGNYAFSKTTIEPLITISEAYNDNIYLSEKDVDSDWVTTVSPEFVLYYDSRELKVDLDYSLLFKYYGNHSEENESSLREVQRGLVDALFFPKRDFTLGLREEISRVVIDDRVQSVTENDLVNKTTLYHFSANPQYQWRVLSTFSLLFGYQYDNYDYVLSDGDDAESHLYRLSLAKKFVTETEVKINGFYEDYQTETQSDYQLQQVSGGLIQRFGPRWRFDAEGGFVWVDFDTGQKLEDSIWAANITGRVAKNLKIILATDRAFFVSVDAGLIKRTQTSVALRFQDVFNVELKTDIEKKADIVLRTDNEEIDDNEKKTEVEPRSYLELKSYWKEDQYLTEDRIDRSFGGQLESGVYLSQNSILSVEGDIGQYKFLPEDEGVLRFGAGVSLEYRGKRKSLSLAYTFRKSNSDIDENDYVNNITTLTVSLRF